MKFNLKNFPIYPKNLELADRVNHSVACTKWKEGFEKELRERQTHWCPETPYNISIKEILGE